MPLAELLLPEFDEEMTATRRVLERVPDGKASWKPHPKSMTLGRLATLVAELPAWAVNALTLDELDIMPSGGPPPKFEALGSTKQILDVFDRNANAARAALIPSVTTGWISCLQNERSLSAKITGELQGVSAQTAREVDLWVKERLYELRVFASSYEVSENLDRIQRPGGERAHERLTGYLRSVRERFADYQELLVVNPEGQEVASTAPQPTSVSLPQGWAKTIRQENAVVGDALWDDALKKGAVVFAVPIYQTGGRFLGALTAKLDFSALHRLLRRFAGGGEESAQVYLVTADGRPVVGSRSDPTELMRYNLPAAVVRRLLEHEGVTREYRGLAGQEVVGTMKAVPRLDWAVLAEVPASEAFRQVTRLRNVTVLIVAALLVAVGLFAYFLGLLITRPLDRLTAAAAKVARGHP